MAEIRLDTPHGCRDELERCSNGIATLIPDLTTAIETLARVEVELELAEALATVEVAQNYPKITATEMKARVVRKLAADDGRGTLRGQKTVLSSTVTALTARMRALEKRMSAAQSALNDHQAEARSAGLVGR